MINNLQKGVVKLLKVNDIKYDFLVYIPAGLRDGKILLWCHGSTPPNPENTLEMYARSDLDYILEYANALELIIITPVLPRERERTQYPFWKYDSQIMSREVMMKELPEEDKVFYRPDLEILKILSFVKNSLNEEGIQVEDKIVAGGFSAGATFSNRFSIIHSDLVEIVILLSSGVFLYPTKTLETHDLNYPFGIGDLGTLDRSNFSLPEFKKIKQFIYVGENETNTKNDILPYETSGNRQLLKNLGEVLGFDPLTRTKNYASYLKDIGVLVELLIGEGLGHRVNRMVLSKAFDFAKRNLN